MNNWKEYYLQTLQAINQIKKFKLSVLLGFNVNIDRIIRLTPKNFPLLYRDINTLNDDTCFNLPWVLRSKVDLLKAIITCMKSNIGAERLILSKELRNWIETNFPAATSQIGGQAGIMANLLTNLNVCEVVLHIPTASNELVALLDRTIKVPVDPTTILSIESLREIDKKDDENVPIHYIFEFKKGFYPLFNNTIYCRSENRFIASYDLINSQAKLNSHFVEYTIANIEKFDIAIISGLHLVETSLHNLSLLEMLEPVVNLIKKWRKLNRKLTIHLEIASTNNAELMRFIAQNIFPIIDSIGLNDVELKMLVEYLELMPSIKNNISLQKPEDIYLCAKALWSQYPNLRIHLHKYGYYMILSKKSSKRIVQAQIKALILAAIGAAIKAKTGTFTTFEDFSVEHIRNFKGIAEIIKLEQFLKKENYLGSLIKKGYMFNNEMVLTCVPTVIIENPIQLVGLGDTISSIALIFEKLFSQAD